MKAIFTFFKNMLNEGTEESSMRFAFLLFCLGVFLILLSIAFYIVRFAIGYKQPDWSGISLLVGGLGAAITAFAWQKVSQKKVENNKNKEK